MASGTIYGSTSNQYIESKIEWSATPNNEDNTSTVKAALYYRRTNEGYSTYGDGTFSIYIGSKKQTFSGSLTITTLWIKAVEDTETVNHNTDGGKIIKISAGGYISGTTLTTTYCYDDVALDTIPRATTIESLTCSTKYFTGDFTYKYTPKNVRHFNRCSVTLNVNGTHTAVKTVDLGRKTASQQTATLTLSDSELTTIYNKLPSTDKGVLRFTIRTYSDSGYSTQVGDAKYKEITLYIQEEDNTRPTAKMTLSTVSSLGSPLNSLYIKGYSKVKATFSDEDGKYGADITSCSMSVQGKSYSSPYTSGYLSTSGSVTVTGTIKDTRGFSRSYPIKITVLDYSKPKILPASDESNIVCERCDGNGTPTSSGTCLKIKARRSYNKLTSGDTQNNHCLIRYRYKTESASSFSSWKTILEKTASSNTVDTKLSDIEFSTTTAYVVQVGVVDDLGNAAAVQFVVPTDSVTLHMAKGGKRLGLLRYAEESDEEGIDVGAPIHGGAVDNLTLGTMLVASSASPIDLNNITEVGNYYSQNASYSKYISNSPYTEGGFNLTVRQLQSTKMIRQELCYARTNWLRYYNPTTSEWSDWLRFLMTEYPDAAAADFVSEIGTHQVDANSYWRYRKWKSGAVDLNGVFQVTPVMDTTTGTAAVRYSTQIQIPLPFKVESFQFTGTPTSKLFLLTNAAITTDSDGNNYAAFRLFRFTDFVDVSVEVRIIASGKYK